MNDIFEQIVGYDPIHGISIAYNTGKISDYILCLPMCWKKELLSICKNQPNIARPCWALDVSFANEDLGHVYELEFVFDDIKFPFMKLK